MVSWFYWRNYTGSFLLFKEQTSTIKHAFIKSVSDTHNSLKSSPVSLESVQWARQKRSELKKMHLKVAFNAEILKLSRFSC